MVYPYSRLVLAALASVCVAVVVLVVVVLSKGPDVWGAIWWGFAIALFGVGALFFAVGCLVCLVMLVRSEPVLRIDGSSTESAGGQVRWDEVEELLEVTRGFDGHETRSLLIVLRSGATVRSPSARYYGSLQFGRLGRGVAKIAEAKGLALPDLGSPAIEVSMHGCRRRVLDAVSRFRTGDVPVGERSCCA